MTTTSATSSATSSIVTALGSGSGIDIGALTKSLVEAQFASKTGVLKIKSETLTAQISGVATLKSGITSFAAALTTLVKGGTLQTQPTSSSAAIGVSALPGAKLSGLSAALSVSRLATAQTATTGSLGPRTGTIGTGTITVTLGTATLDAANAMAGFAAGSAPPIDIIIETGDATLDGIARKINAAGAGVTATVVADADGTARLSLKGRTGATQAFTLDVAEGATPGLAAIAVGVDQPTTIASAAGNARVTLDGITVERASNTVTDLIDGVKLELLATTAAPAILGSSTPSAALTQAVVDVVDAYNELLAQVKEQTDPITGPLRGDPGARTLLSGLRSLTLTPLLPSGAAGPGTLAEIGIATARDGTLSVNADRLASAINEFPATIEAIFAPGTGAERAGLSALLNTVSLNANSSLFGLGASTNRYTAGQSALADQQARLDDQSAAMQTRLTKQFAGMDARVAAYKSTQTFLENQIKAWNADR